MIKSQIITISDLTSKHKKTTQASKDLKQLINKKRTYQFHLEKLRESEINIASALLKKSNITIEAIKNGIERDTLDMIEICKDDHEVYFEVLMELLKNRIKKESEEVYCKSDERLFERKGVNDVIVEFNRFKEKDIEEEFRKVYKEKEKGIGSG